MNESTIDLRDILRVLKKRRGLIARVFFTAVLLALVVSFLIPPTYQASTTLRIKQTKSLGTSLLDEMGGGGAGASKQKMSTYAEIMKSRTVVEAVIEKTQQEKEALPSYEGFVGRITTTPVRDTEILRVLVTAPTAMEAQVVTNTLVQTFVSRMTELVRSEHSTVREFIAERLKEAVKELNDSESALADYRTKQKVVSPADETKAIVERLSGINRILAENEVATATARGRLANVRSQLGSAHADFLADSPLIQQLKSKIAEREVELAGLLQKYTEKYPQVLATRAAIAESKEKLSIEVARIVSSRAPGTNPIHVGLIQSRIQAEVEIQAAAHQREAIRQVLAKNEVELNALPSKEQGLARVMRDAATAQEIYGMLTKRHEEARINEVMQSTDAQVVDPAVAPQGPIRPRKALIVAIAAMLGLFLGLGMAFVLEYMNRTIRTPEDVQDYLDLPVLGSIPDFDAVGQNGKTKGTGDYGKAVQRLRSIFGDKKGGKQHG